MRWGSRDVYTGGGANSGLGSSWGRGLLGGGGGLEVGVVTTACFITNILVGLFLARLLACLEACF